MHKSLAIQTYSISWLVCTIFSVIAFLCDVWEFSDLIELPYLCLVFISLPIGIMFGLSIKSRKNPVYFSSKNILTTSNININKYLMIFLVFMSVAGGLSLLISSGGFSGDLEAQRNSHLNSVPEVTPLSYLGQFGISFGYIGASILPWTNQKLRTKLLWGIVMSIGFVLASLSNGGRITMLISFILLTFSLLLKNIEAFARIKISTKVTFISLIVFFVMCLGYWSAIRGDSYLPTVFIRNTGKITNVLQFFGLDTNPEIYMAMSVTLLYLITSISGGILNFAPFYIYYNPVPLYGSYQLDSIFVRFGFDWYKNKAEMENLYAKLGMHSNVWGTFVREFVMDFGWIGAVIASLFVGYLIAKIEKSHSNSITNTSVYVFVLTWLLMSPLYSLLIFKPFQISCLILFIFLFSLVFKPRKYVVRL